MAKWKEQFIEGGRKGLSGGRHQQSSEEEIDELSVPGTAKATSRLEYLNLTEGAWSRCTRNIALIQGISTRILKPRTIFLSHSRIASSNGYIFGPFPNSRKLHISKDINN